MANAGSARGMIAVDKMGGKVLFLNPDTYETEVVLEGFPRTVHELLVVPETGLAYVPIFGDGIHGRNPNPHHLLCIFDLEQRAHVGDIDLRPYIAPHTLKLGPDGLIYITCENSAVVAVIDRQSRKVVDAIDSGSTNGHRLIIATDGQRLYTENEEDGTVSVIDLPGRKLLGGDGSRVSGPAQAASRLVSFSSPARSGDCKVLVAPVSPTKFRQIGGSCSRSFNGVVGAWFNAQLARSAPACSQGDSDEKDARRFARGCDDRRHLSRHCNGRLRPVARPRMGMERRRMGSRRCRRRHRRRDCRRRHHCVATARLCGVSRLRRTGLWTGLLLGIAAGVRSLGPRRRLYGSAGAGVSGLCRASAARLCRTARAAARGCAPTEMTGYAVLGWRS
jgi:hypothetical protein